MQKIEYIIQAIYWILGLFIIFIGVVVSLAIYIFIDFKKSTLIRLDNIEDKIWRRKK